MPKEKRPNVRAKAASKETHRPSEGPQERAESLLERLESRGTHLITAAEELDRLQGSLERLERREWLHERVAELCEAWSEVSLRGEPGQAWLTLVGAFDLKEHAPRVADLVEESGAPAALRMQACRVLARLGGPEATASLARVLAARSDAQVRVAAAEALGNLRDASIRPMLEELLDEDLPKPVWSAVSEALDRIPYR